MLELAFRVRVEAAHPNVADAVTVQGVLLNPVCQEEIYNPGRDVSINSKENSILTPQHPVPDVRLGFRVLTRFVLKYTLRAAHLELGGVEREVRRSGKP